MDDLEGVEDKLLPLGEYLVEVEEDSVGVVVGVVEQVGVVVSVVEEVGVVGVVA